MGRPGHHGQPLHQGQRATVEVIVNSFWDVAVEHPVAFASRPPYTRPDENEITTDPASEPVSLAEQRRNSG